METLTIGSNEAQRGQTTYGELPITVMAADHHIRLPIHIIHGSEEGPCVGVVAVQHGHEFSVLNIQRQLLRLLDAATLRGTVICVPIINPIAFEWASRGGWSDGLWGPHGDIGRLWPGDHSTCPDSDHANRRKAHDIQERSQRPYLPIAVRK